MYDEVADGAEEGWWECRIDVGASAGAEGLKALEFGVGTMVVSRCVTDLWMFSLALASTVSNRRISSSIPDLRFDIFDFRRTM